MSTRGGTPSKVVAGIPSPSYYFLSSPGPSTLQNEQGGIENRRSFTMKHALRFQDAVTNVNQPCFQELGTQFKEQDIAMQTMKSCRMKCHLF